jgi:hypothetical protein
MSRKLLVLLALCLVGTIVAYRIWGWGFDWSLFVASLSGGLADRLDRGDHGYLLVPGHALANPSGASESRANSPPSFDYDRGIFSNFHFGQGRRNCPPIVADPS